MSIKDEIMGRDGLADNEADELIQEARHHMCELLEAGDIDSAYEICSDYFGLEPDYLIELV